MLERVENVGMHLPSDILFIRHGQYPSNVATATTGEAALEVKKLPDEEDAAIGLNATGRSQARYLGRHLLRIFPGGFMACMRSDFARVAQTVEIALSDIEHIVVEPALRERHRGDMARMPKVTFEELYPEELAKKRRSPLDWKPANGETLRDKAVAVRKLLPSMGMLAPNQPLPVFTSGEVVIAARTVPELGNMDNEALKHGLTDGWPALSVENAQFDHYTRQDPETGELGTTFDYFRSMCAHTEVVRSSGWIRIQR